MAAEDVMGSMNEAGYPLLKMSHDLAQEIKAFALECGADMVGVADLERLQEIRTHPNDLLNGYTHAISVGIRLKLVGAHDSGAQERSFSLLEGIAVCLEKYIGRRGYLSCTVPPDGRAGRRRPLSRFGAISHKAVARAAGLGWIGKSTLLVTPRFGPRVCLITVLTDMPLASDRPLDEMCGSCRRCIVACPVGALAESAAGHGYSRGKLDVQRCGSFHVRIGRGAGACYECILACPWGTPRATTDDTPEEVVTRLHNAWLGREEGCRKAGHANRRSRLLSYGKHVQVIELCNSCFRTGKREHRQLAQSLVAGREAHLGQP